jgi:hypothetical protein
MDELSKYTDEELREELRRRAQEKRKNQKHEITYIEFEATIDKVDNTLGYKGNGDIRYKPFMFWKYRIKDCSLELANSYPWHDYYNKQGCFKRDNAPQIGDRVKLRYRRTKGHEVFDLHKAKIIEIIK